MNIIGKIFSTICIIAFLIPAYGQEDTITADGLYLKYNSRVYIGAKGVSDITSEKLHNKDFSSNTPSVLLRGELERVTKHIGLNFKTPAQYIISESFILKSPPINPEELIKSTHYGIILSQWIHEDGDCILFITCPIINANVDKSITEFPKSLYASLRYVLDIEPIQGKLTEEQIKKIKKKLTFWSPERAKKTFQAQHVITFPVKDKKSVYMDKYSHKLELKMIKWGQDFSISFLVTKNGEKNINKYISDVEKAFWFED
jgi:hypothetical protein